MPTNLKKLVEAIPERVKNKANAKELLDFNKFKTDRDNSEREILNCLQPAIYLAEYLRDIKFIDVKTKEPIEDFLKEREKHKNEIYKKLGKEPDPNKWARTFKGYLDRIIHFYRWLHNKGNSDPSSWKTPAFLLEIKRKKDKRERTYDDSELWERHEVQFILPYERHLRNKAIIGALWDLNGRNHEITKLEIRHLTFKEEYAEGVIPDDTKTGGRPMMIILGFPYLRDLKNIHPFKNNPRSKVFLSFRNNMPLEPDTIWRILDDLKKRIEWMVKEGQITDDEEKRKLGFLLNTRRWNPYCFRHSSSTDDADYLSRDALIKKAGWTPKSKQPNTYIGRKFGPEIKRQILLHNGIKLDDSVIPKPVNQKCWKCNHVNALENNVCQSCGCPLTKKAYQEIRAKEEERYQSLEQSFSAKIEKLEQNFQVEIQRQMNIVIGHLQVTNETKEELIKEVNSNPDGITMLCNKNTTGHETEKKGIYKARFYFDDIALLKPSKSGQIELDDRFVAAQANKKL